MADDYEWDFFLSYKRGGDVEEWVRNHFKPRLERSLENELHDKKKIFIDTSTRTGTKWPQNIKKALKNSKILISIWSPPYFLSDWCDAEWRSMRKREEQVGLTSEERPEGLVYPVAFSDGEYFPESAKNVQQFCLRDFYYPYPCFKDAPIYMSFCDKVRDIAIELGQMLESVPPWQEWDLEEADPMNEVVSGVPR